MHKKTIEKIKLFQKKTPPPPHLQHLKRKKKEKKRYTNRNSHKDFPKYIKSKSQINIALNEAIMIAIYFLSMIISSGISLIFV